MLATADIWCTILVPDGGCRIVSIAVVSCLSLSAIYWSVKVVWRPVHSGQSGGRVCDLLLTVILVSKNIVTPALEAC